MTRYIITDGNGNRMIGTTEYASIEEAQGILDWIHKYVTDDGEIERVTDERKEAAKMNLPKYEIGERLRFTVTFEIPEAWVHPMTMDEVGEYLTDCLKDLGEKKNKESTT